MFGKKITIITKDTNQAVLKSLENTIKFAWQLDE